MWKAFGHWPYNQRQVSYRDFERETEPVSTLQELQSGAADPYSGLWRRKSWSRRRRKEGKKSLEAISLLHTKCSALQLLSVKYSKGKKKSTPALILNFDSNKSCLLLPSEGPPCPSAELSKSVTAIKAVHSLWRCCCCCGCCGCWLFCNNLCRPVRMKLNSLVSNPK